MISQYIYIYILLSVQKQFSNFADFIFRRFIHGYNFKTCFAFLFPVITYNSVAFRIR